MMFILHQFQTKISIQDHLLSKRNIFTHFTNQEHVLVYKQQNSGRRELPARLQLQLCAPPVSPLGVVTDGVSSSHSDPLGDGAVLLPFLGKLPLDPEGLQGRHCNSSLLL